MNKKKFFRFALFLLLASTVLIGKALISDSDDSTKDLTVNNISSKLNPNAFSSNDQVSRSSLKQDRKTYTSESLWVNYLNKSKGLKGQDLLNLQYDIAGDALSRFQGLEMLNFIELMSREGSQEVVDFLLSGAILSDTTEREAVLDQVIALQDRQLQEKVLRRVGREFTELHDVSGFLSRVSDLKGKNQFITSYCLGLISIHEPSVAVDKYLNLSRGVIDQESFAGFLKLLPKNTSFANVVESIMRELPQENHNFQVSVSMQTWAQHDPEAALDFVVNNSSSVARESVNKIVVNWLLVSPKNAENWYDSCADGNIKSDAAVALATHYSAINQGKAFKFASEVGNFDEKVAICTSIFKEWAKVDKLAAEAAWVQVFPQ